MLKAERDPLFKRLRRLATAGALASIAATATATAQTPADEATKYQATKYEPTEGGLTWGLGPSVLYPTASNRVLGAKQWGLGPTAVGVWMNGPVTFLMLGLHNWGINPPSDRKRVNQSFGQAALAYTTPTRTTYFVSTESSYDFSREQGTVPLQAGVNQLFVFGGAPIQLGGLFRYYAVKPEGGPNWGFQLRATFIFAR